MYWLAKSNYFRIKLVPKWQQCGLWRSSQYCELMYCTVRISTQPDIGSMQVTMYIAFISLPHNLPLFLFPPRSTATYVLCCVIATNCTLQTKIVGSGNTAVCAGDRLTFTCNASSSSTTQERWIGSNWGGDQVTVSVSDSLGASLLRANNVFNVSFVSKTPFITKVEVANATLDLNGITVTCQETTNGATFVEVGTGCIIMAG